MLVLVLYVWVLALRRLVQLGRQLGVRDFDRPFLVLRCLGVCLCDSYRSWIFPFWVGGLVRMGLEVWQWKKIVMAYIEVLIWSNTVCPCLR